MKAIWNALRMVLVIALLATMAACHTIHGAGQDIEGTGKAIERATD